MRKKLPLLFFWSPSYFLNAGRLNYSSSSTFYLFCSLNFTNNHAFHPLNLLLNCHLHPHCFTSWNLRDSEMDHILSVGFHAWDTLLLKASFSLHCAIIGCLHSVELHDSDNCDQPIRKHGLWQSWCIPQVESVSQSCQDSYQLIFTNVQGSLSWL